MLRTELLALRTIRAPWTVAGLAVALTGALAVNAVLNSGRAGAPSIGTAGAMLSVLGAVRYGALAVLVLGVLAVTVESRHGTVTATFLQTPKRLRVMTAKAGAIALAAAAVAVADLAVALAVGVSTGAVQRDLANADIALHVLGLLLAYPAYGVLGVGIGALIGCQPVAVLLPVAWVLALEDMALTLLPPAVGRWSLRGLSSALANAGDVADVVPMAVGGVALAAVTAALWGLGALRIARHDVT